jgi:hypothetical protein
MLRLAQHSHLRKRLLRSTTGIRSLSSTTVTHNASSSERDQERLRRLRADRIFPVVEEWQLPTSCSTIPSNTSAESFDNSLHQDLWSRMDRVEANSLSISSSSLPSMSPAEVSALEDATTNMLLELFRLNDAAESSLPSRAASSRPLFSHSNNVRGNHMGYFQNPTFYNRQHHLSSACFSTTTPKQEEEKKKTDAKHIPSSKLDKTRVPTPPSSPHVDTNPLKRLASTDPKSVVRKGLDMTVSTFSTILRFLFRLPGNLFYYGTNPAVTRQKWADMKHLIREEVNHYWVGTKVRSIEGLTVWRT